MTTVSIIYYTGAGHTAVFADAVAKGVTSVTGAKANVISISGDDIVNGRYRNDDVLAALDSSDAIIFGSPTYMGGPASQFKAFADATVERWSQQKWRDKFAAGFTVSGGLSGDKFSVLQYFQTLAMQHGMIWVGLGELPGQPNGVNRLSSFIGAMAQVEAEPTVGDQSNGDKLTSERLGARVATIASKHC